MRLRLNTLLLQHHLTKTEVAQRIDGVYSYTADILNGRRRPSRLYAERIAAVFGEDPRALFREWEPGLFEPFSKGGVK